jgi:hypothetical protein
MYMVTMHLCPTSKYIYINTITPYGILFPFTLSIYMYTKYVHLIYSQLLPKKFGFTFIRDTRINNVWRPRFNATYTGLIRSLPAVKQSIAMAVTWSRRNVSFAQCPVCQREEIQSGLSQLGLQCERSYVYNWFWLCVGKPLCNLV